MLKADLWQFQLFSTNKSQLQYLPSVKEAYGFWIQASPNEKFLCLALDGSQWFYEGVISFLILPFLDALLVKLQSLFFSTFLSHLRHFISI